MPRVEGRDGLVRQSFTQLTQILYAIEKDLTSQTNGAIDRPPTEVVPRARRRRFSAAYKLRILQEADACKESKDIGSLLRREGLYASQLSQWRKQRSEGVLVGGQQAATEIATLAAQLEAAEKENQRLKKRLSQAEAIIEVQKKISDVFGISNQSDEDC